MTGAPGVTSAVPARPRRRSLGMVLLLLALVGSISTAFWIGAAHLPDPRRALFSSAIWLALLACVTLTTVNLVMRWFRWHFLIRRFTHGLTTRDSLAVYLATLPAIMTPFFVGELVRVLMLRRHSGTRASHLAWVWAIERLLDAFVLTVFFLLVTHPPLGLVAAALVLALTYLMFRLILDDRRARNVAVIASIAVTATVLAWLLPALALVATVGLAGHAISFSVGLEAFSSGTLFGGLSGFPLGVSITGSTMIEELLSSGVPAEAGVIGVLVFRVGTSFFAVALGVAVFLFSRARLGRIMRHDASYHFDAIAHAYEHEIPKHVRDRLLARKISLIQARLADAGIAAGARGLDLGCGQGSYLNALASAGFRVHGLDSSAGQLAKAVHAAAALGLCRADAEALPFPDGAFDFVYSINAFHHLPSRAAHERAMHEIVRVLRPGGAFVLHEINTRNPVFRLYVSYLFPLMKQIDEGTEQWILPSALPPAPGAAWADEVQYFTFTPDFVPHALDRPAGAIERMLERSALRRYSAHYQACLVKKRT